MLHITSIAFRLKNILTHLINDIPGILMASNIRMVYDMVFYTEKNNIHGLLLLIYFAAAFDSVFMGFYE